MPKNRLRLPTLFAFMSFLALSAPGAFADTEGQEKVLINQARQCLKVGDAQQAIVYCNEVLKFAPKSSSAYVKRAEARLLLGDYALALKDCDLALAIDKRNDAFYRKGCALAGLGRYKEALPLFDMVVTRNPEHALYYFFRAGCKQKMKDYSGALVDYHSFERLARASGENNTKSKAFKESVECARALHREDLEETEIKNWLAVDGENPTALRAQAEWSLLNGRKKEALGAYKKLLVIDPADSDALSKIEKLTGKTH